MKKKIELTLPKVMELSGMMEETSDRCILMHVRSASVGEILDEGQGGAYDERRAFKFTYNNIYDIEESMVLLMHFVAADDNVDDWDEDVTEKAVSEIIDYYCEYCRWEDRNIEQMDKNAALGIRN